MYCARKSLGGGVLLDSHELDYTTWLLGPVARVGCMAAKVSGLEIDTEDLASLQLEMVAGAYIQVQVDYLQRSYQRSYEFIGSEGTLCWNFAKQQVSLYQAATGAWAEWAEPSDFSFNDMYLDQTRHVLDVCEGRCARAVTSLWDGLRVLRLIEAARRSSESGVFVRIDP
jgi:predicted dehydrogenase